MSGWCVGCVDFRENLWTFYIYVLVLISKKNMPVCIVMTPYHEAFNALTFLDNGAKKRRWSSERIINIQTAAQDRKYQVTKYYVRQGVFFSIIKVITFSMHLSEILGEY